MDLSRRQFVAAASAATASLSAMGSNQFVRTRGKDIVDPAGTKLRLRGINLGNWFEPEGYMFLFDHGPQSPREIEAFVNELIGPDEAAAFWREYREQYITPRDIAFIKQAGFNSVRIPLHYKFFLPNASGFEVLDPLSTRAARNPSGSSSTCTARLADKPVRTSTTVGAIRGSTTIHKPSS